MFAGRPIGASQAVEKLVELKTEFRIPIDNDHPVGRGVALGQRLKR
jgi:hypothetical protein